MAIRAFSSSSFLRHYRDDVMDLAAWRLFDGIDPAAEAVSRMLEPAKIDPVGGVPLPIRLVASSPAHDFHAIEVAELRVRLSRMVNDSVPALPDKVVDGLTQLIHTREYAIVRATTRAHRSYAVYMTYYVNLAYIFAFVHLGTNLSQSPIGSLKGCPGMPIGGSESGSSPSVTMGGAHEVHPERDMMESIP